MIGLKADSPRRSHVQLSKNLNSSHSNTPLPSTGWTKPFKSVLAVMPSPIKGWAFRSDEQSKFGKIDLSISTLWLWLVMIPYVQRALNWHSERQIRIEKLQDQCIEKAHQELKEETQQKGYELASKSWLLVEHLKIRQISDWEKQYHQDYCIASNLDRWQWIQKTLQINLSCIEDVYRSMNSEKELRRHLALPRQPIL